MIWSPSLCSVISSPCPFQRITIHLIKIDCLWCTYDWLRDVILFVDFHMEEFGKPVWNLRVLMSFDEERNEVRYLCMLRWNQGSIRHLRIHAKIVAQLVLEVFDEFNAVAIVLFEVSQYNTIVSGVNVHRIELWGQLKMKKNSLQKDKEEFRCTTIFLPNHLTPGRYVLTK